MFSQQLLTFKNNIGPYAATLGLSAAQVAAHGADADRFAYELECQDICGNCAEQWTAWKDITRNGGTPPATGAPIGVTLPTPAPAAVAPGIEPRFRALVNLLKASGNYSVATGEVLGTEGPEQTGPDFATFKPVLKPKLSGGHVLVVWGWQGQSEFLDMIEIEVDRGTGAGSGLLAYDTTPNYLDTAPPPAAGAKWTYRAIFRVGDQRVGQWSDAVSINVSA